MKLHFSIASPYVRKVMAVAIETGLEARLEPVNRTMTPVKPDADLVRDNPLGKIPCLVTDDGAVLYDSRVVCEYLDSLHDGPKMFPPSGPARWTALRRPYIDHGDQKVSPIARQRLCSAGGSRRLPADIQRAARRKLTQLDRAQDMRGLVSSPGNRLEALKGDRRGQHSIRINDQWRICFVWCDGDVHEFEIVDYHP